MRLADLILSDLPFEALTSLKHAINDELLRRKKQRYVTGRTEYLSRFSFRDSARDVDYETAIHHWIAENAQHLLAIPQSMRQRPWHERLPYSFCVLAQDWTFLFPTAATTDSTCYVYAHVDPRKRAHALPALQLTLKGVPFYIGKGSGRRAWDLKRNQGHGKIIQQIRDDGFDDSTIVQILADSLTEQDALILEAQLIYLFGSIYDATINGCLMNLADHIKPTFVRDMPKLLPRKAYHAQRQAKIKSLDSSLAPTAPEARPAAAPESPPD